MFQQTDCVNLWEQLQEPKYHSNYPASYFRLMAALDAGWRIHWIGLQPDRQGDKPGEYFFALARSDGKETKNMRLPHCRELAEFICSEYLFRWSDTQNFLL